MMTKLEDLIEHVNGFGRYQKLGYTLICFSGLLAPISSYIHSFIAASVKYDCSIDSSNDKNNFTFEKGLSYYYSKQYINKCNINSINQNITQIYLKNHEESDFSNQSIFSNNITNNVICKFDKTYYKKTLTEEWNLVCNNAIWRSNMQAVYFIGIFVGSIFQGILSKKFGQKMTLVFSLLATIFGCLLLSFGPQKIFDDLISYILLIIGRMLTAVGSHGVSINGYFLVMETIGRSQKKYCSLVFEFIFPLGQLVLVFAAFFLREWRYLTFIVLLPCVPFLCYIIFSNESIQYLILKKKNDQLQKVLERIAKTNNTELDEILWKSLLVKVKEKENVSKKNTPGTKTKLNLFYVIIIIISWIINNFVFHGLGLRSNDLGANPYLTFALSAILELLASLFTFKISEYRSRRKLYLILILITGVCCTTVYFSKNLLLTVGSALLAKFSIASSYAIIRLYTNELFTEYDGKNYLTLCSIMARLGSIIAPFIICLGDYKFKQLPFLIFGTSCFISALLTLILPRILLKTSNQEQKSNLEKSQQILQNNWLDGEDIYLDDDHEDDMINLAIEEIEIKQLR